tara:strand:- start:307 stop:1476 length:1170 start_codon:yes stop_codon:yes gene_type:complete
LKKIIKKKINELKLSNKYRVRRAKDSGNSHIFVYKKKEYLSFASNDYLSLANDKRIISSAKKALDKHGYSTSSSALISGYSKSHFALEEELSSFLGQEKTLLFSTGYQANLGVIKSLVNRGGYIFADNLNHASLIDGSILSRANFKRYKHKDIGNLEELLEKTKSLENKLIISDSLFSMDGDFANLKKLKSKLNKHKATMLIDEAHSLGIFGKGGSGLLVESALNNKDDIFLTGTFGKSIGTFGAFFSGKKDVVDFVMQNSRGYIYSTSLPINTVEATRKSLKIIKKEDWRREKLFSLINYFKCNIKNLNLSAINSDSQIQALMVGSSKDALFISNELMKAGIYIPAIRPPTVEEGKSRLRISLTVDHSEKDISYLLNILDKLSRNLVQ